MAINLPVGMPDVMVPRGATLMGLLQEEDSDFKGTGIYSSRQNPAWVDAFGQGGRTGRWSKVAVKNFELTYVGKLFPEVEDTFIQLMKERGFRIMENFFFLATRRVRDIILHGGIMLREEDYMFSQIRIPYLTLWIPDRPFPPGVGWLDGEPPTGPYAIWTTWYVDMDFELIWQRNPVLKHMLPYYLKYVKRRRLEELVKKCQQELREVDKEWRRRTARLMRMK